MTHEQTLSEMTPEQVLSETPPEAFEWAAKLDGEPCKELKLVNRKIVEAQRGDTGEKVNLLARVYETEKGNRFMAFRPLED